MNFGLPFKLHKWRNRMEWRKCDCGCSEFVYVEYKQWCRRKFVLFAKENGYIITDPREKEPEQ